MNVFFWGGGAGLSNATFRVQPLLTSGDPMGETEFVRSGLLGFLGPGGLVFVCGSRDGLMTGAHLLSFFCWYLGPCVHSSVIEVRRLDS